MSNNSTALIEDVVAYGNYNPNGSYGIYSNAGTTTGNTVFGNADVRHQRANGLDDGQRRLQPAQFVLRGQLGRSTRRRGLTTVYGNAPMVCSSTASAEAAPR